MRNLAMSAMNIARLHLRHIPARSVAPRGFWSGLSAFKGSSGDGVGSGVGAFGVWGLHKPQDWDTLTTQAIDRCERIRSDARKWTHAHAHTQPHPNLTAPEQLKLLDTISNELCMVIDAAELCRNVHESEVWRSAAENAFARVSAYIAQLNTAVELYDALKCIADDTEVFQSLSVEAQRFTISLKQEFERDGIQLPHREREEVRECIERMTEVETVFSQNVITANNHTIKVPKGALTGVPSQIWAHVPQPEEAQGMIMLPTDMRTIESVLQTSANAHLREALYTAAYDVSSQNITVLKDLILARHTVAQKLGFESHLHRTLQDKMLSTPHEVTAFLESVAQRIKPHAHVEAQQLLELKVQHENHTQHVTPVLQPWDVQHYTAQLRSLKCSDYDPSDMLVHLELNNCTHALKLLCERLFGLTVTAEPAPQNETWSSDGTILKLTVRDPARSEGPLGHIYLDLHPRTHKFTTAAHFSVRSGCAAHDEALTKHLVDIGEVFSPHICEETTSNGFQIPVVALVMNVRQMNGRCFLAHSELETLFHEFGHALHSLLSRTTFQHLSGTRTAGDFVEIPSQLMENFAWSHDTLRHFASHYITRTHVSSAVLERAQRSKQFGKHLETLNTVYYALFDQRVFSRETAEALSDPDTDAAEFLSNLAKTVHAEVMPSNMVPSEKSHWMARHGHLTTYGATYYAYLYDQVFAAQLWEELFEGSVNGTPLNAKAGREKLWEHLLKPGNAVDPHDVIRKALGGKDPSAEAFYRKLGLSHSHVA